MNIKKYFNSNNSCFLDIETTGLSRKNNIIYLVGILYPMESPGKWTLKQYFANGMDKEKLLLNRLVDDISSYDNIITYNGDSFDIPFLNHRLEHYGIETFVDKSKSIDLYRIIRQNKQYLDLPNLKLKTIEESLGYYREDTYSGFDCIGFYYDYINSKSLDLKDKILGHNYDDLMHMLDIIKILDILDDKKIVFINIYNCDRKVKIDDIKILGDMVDLSGTITPYLEKDIKYYGSNYSIRTDNLNNFIISMEFKEGYITKKDKCIYIDLLDFPLLNLQNNTHKNLPDNIFVLMVEKKYCPGNIKCLLTSLFENCIL